MDNPDPRRQVAELGTILSIWAHPDDETYVAGGVMAAAVANGQRVVCVSATVGERGTDDPDTWPPERLGRVRRQPGGLRRGRTPANSGEGASYLVITFPR